MEVSRSGYYKWKDRPESERGRQHKEWTEQVKEVFETSRKLYGSPKVTQKLRQQGVNVSERTVTRIMHEQQWRSRTVRKYKAKTNSKHNLPVHENVLNQDFTATKPNEKWVTDITYSDVLHHSDRGSQYASHDYQKQLQIYSMKSSMSRKGNCYDNACIESFHSIIKKELIYLNKYQTREEAQKSIFDYIEVFYNNQRIHSSIQYLTPDEFERNYYFNAAKQ
jgi:putative transposase